MDNPLLILDDQQSSTVSFVKHVGILVLSLRIIIKESYNSLLDIAKQIIKKVLYLLKTKVENSKLLQSTILLFELYTSKDSLFDWNKLNPFNDKSINELEQVIENGNVDVKITDEDALKEIINDIRDLNDRINLKGDGEPKQQCEKCKVCEKSQEIKECEVCEKCTECEKCKKCEKCEKCEKCFSLYDFLLKILEWIYKRIKPIIDWILWLLKMLWKGLVLIYSCVLWIFTHSWIFFCIYILLVSYLLIVNYIDE